MYWLYADMARWEIQQRMRPRGGQPGASNFTEDVARKYKRAILLTGAFATASKAAPSSL